MNTALAAGRFGVPLLARDMFGATAFSISMMVAIGTGAYVLFCPLLGRMTERIGRKRSIMTGVILYAVTYALVLASRHLWHLFALSFFSGLAQSMFWPALEAAIADEASHEDLDREVGFFNVSWCVGAALGAAAGGILYDSDVRLPILFTLAFMPPLLAVAALTPGGNGPKNTSAAPEEETPPPSGGVNFMLLGWMANLGAWSTVAVMRALFAPDVTARLGFSGAMAGRIVAVMGLAQSVTFAVMLLTRKWRYNLPLFFGIQALVGVGTLVTFFAARYMVLVAAFVMIGVGIAMTYYSSIYYSLHGQSARGHKAGVHESILGVGVLAGLIVGGNAARVTQDSRSLYLVCAGLCLLFILIQGIMVWRVKMKIRR